MAAADWPSMTCRRRPTISALIRAKSCLIKVGCESHDVATGRIVGSAHAANERLQAIGVEGLTVGYQELHTNNEGTEK
jgi:hypothetical protein